MITHWKGRSPFPDFSPLFRAIDQLGMASDRPLSSDSVARIVKRAAGRAGLNAIDYAGHSLRAGLATQAAMNGASELRHHEANRPPLALYRASLHRRRGAVPRQRGDQAGL